MTFTHCAQKKIVEVNSIKFMTLVIYIILYFWTIIFTVCLPYFVFCRWCSFIKVFAYNFDFKFIIMLHEWKMHIKKEGEPVGIPLSSGYSSNL